MNEPVNHRRKILVPNFGRGKELADLLRAELKIPQQIKWFQVRFAVGEAVSVVCEFMPYEEVTNE